MKSKIFWLIWDFAFMVFDFVFYSYCPEKIWVLILGIIMMLLFIYQVKVVVKAYLSPKEKMYYVTTEELNKMVDKIIEDNEKDI